MTPRMAVPSDIARHLPEAKVTSEFTQHLPEAKQSRVPQTGYPGNVPHLSAPGMEEAVELAKSACANTVFVNSCFMNLCKHFFWYPMGLEYWFEGQNQAYALWMDLATHWFGLLTPHSASAPAPPMPRFSKHPEPTPERAAPKLETAVKETIEQKIESDIEGKIEQEVEEKIESEMAGKIEKEIEQKIETDIEEKIEKEMRERIEAEIEKEIEEIEEIEHGIDVAVEAFEEGILA